jgi:cytochrome c oxidase subunit 2
MSPARTLRIACVLLLALVSGARAADDAAGRRLFEPCTACHGRAAEGNQSLGAPRLAGLPDWYLTRQLRNFRKGVRGADEEADPYGSQMARMAEQLWDDGEVDAVAAYISTLPTAPPSRTLRAKPARAKPAFATCAACHGEGGGGNVDVGAPPLTGLDDWYVVKQLTAFRAGVRGAHEADTLGQQMRAAAATLPDERAITDMAAYLGTLR